MNTSIINNYLSLNTLFYIALFGLGLATFSDHLQTWAKYRGAINNKLASGYNLAMKVMVGNRIGAALYFLLIAYCIDNSLDIKTLTNGLSITTLIISIPIILSIKIIIGMSNKQHGLQLKKLQIAIILAAFTATTFNILGLTLPWIAGANHPNLRLTLANTSFFFNTVFTIINVFYIEHKLATLIDNDANKIHSLVIGITVGRFLGFVFTGLILWVIF